MVKVQVAGHDYYLNHYLRDNLDKLKASLRKDWDQQIIVAGRERFGKSTLAAQCALYVDPTYNLDRCCFTAEQFLTAVENAKKYQAVVFDESYGYLNTRQVMSKFNRTLVKVMTEMGSKNLFIFIVLPNFFELDKYAAIHRSTALLHVHRRGRFSVYNYNKKKNLYLLGKKFYSYKGVKPNFIGSFVKYFPLDKETYEQKKLASVMTVKEKIDEFSMSKQMEQRNMYIKWISKNSQLTQSQIGEISGLKGATISDILKKMS